MSSKLIMLDLYHTTQGSRLMIWSGNKVVNYRVLLSLWDISYIIKCTQCYTCPKLSFEQANVFVNNISPSAYDSRLHCYWCSFAFVVIDEVYYRHSFNILKREFNCLIFRPRVHYNWEMYLFKLTLAWFIETIYQFYQCVIRANMSLLSWPVTHQFSRHDHWLPEGKGGRYWQHTIQLDR